MSKVEEEWLREMLEVVSKESYIQGCQTTIKANKV